MFDGLELGITWFHLHHTVPRSETGSSNRVARSSTWTTGSLSTAVRKAHG